ncbi:MAG: hypothetical protein J7J93_02290 [Candidatus Aenigmarchaeota archaeon]|nr:hypothetical protein [Candidatus Aenigmarchaeota archaeon]
MAFEKRTDNVTMGKWYYDNFWPINREAPIRPLLFPFLLSILHSFLGYRVENVFILNFIALFCLLSLVYIYIKKNRGNLWGFSAIMFIVSQPLVTITATSGGFDLFNTLFFIICIICLWHFLKNPSPIQFQLLWVNLLMYANIRYESIFLFLITLIYLFSFRYIKKEFFKGNRYIYFLTPLIFLLGFWQFCLHRDIFKHVEYSPHYFIENNKTFFLSFLRWNFFYPFVTIINFIGVLFLFYYLFCFLKKKLCKTKVQKHLILIVGTFLIFKWIIFTSYYEGMPELPTSTRYYLDYMILFSFLSLELFTCFKIFKQKPIYIFLISIMLFIFYNPVAIENRFLNWLLLPRKYRFVMRFLKKESNHSRNFLIITTRPGTYTVYNYGAVNFKYANTSKSVIEEFNNHLYEKIFVIQDIEYKTLKPTPETWLSKKYVLKPITELQNNSEYFIRISEVVFASQKD